MVLSTALAFQHSVVEAIPGLFAKPRRATWIRTRIRLWSWRWPNHRRSGHVRPQQATEICNFRGHLSTGRLETFFSN